MKRMKRIIIKGTMKNRIYFLTVACILFFLFITLIDTSGRNSFELNFSSKESAFGRETNLKNVDVLRQQLQDLVENQLDQAASSLPVGFDEPISTSKNFSFSIGVLMVESRCDARISAVLENAARLLPNSPLTLVHARNNADYLRALAPVIFFVPHYRF